MKFNLTINDIEKTELADVIKALTVINCGEIPVITTSNPIENLCECVCGCASDEISPLEENIMNSEDEVVYFDKEGLPWDERIHSSNKKLTAKGVWQRRKNIEDSYYESIKNELLGVTPAETPVAPVVEEVVETPVVAPAVVSTPVTPISVVEEPAVPVDCTVLYQEMFEKVKNGFGTRLLDANYIQGVIANYNAVSGKSYKGLAEMKDDADALKFVINDLVAKGL